MSKQIYIVDDEPSLLHLLGLCLRRLDRSWRVTEFSAPSQAIAAVRNNPPHLVISDQDMPGMSGTEMLELIRQIAPGTVRMMISSHVGHSDHLAAAHQYLGKPFALQELEPRIRQALAAQQCLQNPRFAALVTSLTSFPVLPSVCSDLLRELENEDSTLESTADLLRQDGGLLTRVLQAANSPLFGGPSAVTDSKAAILRLGTRNVKALVLSMHVFERYQRLHFPEMPVELLWRHSCRTARLARELCAQALGEAAACDAFFAGLVHDLGCLVLMENQPGSFRTMCQKAQQETKPLCQAEKETFQAIHEELSAFMLRLWGIPEPVVEAVTHHNAPWQAPQAGQFSPTVALYMANIVTRQQSPPDRLMTPELDRKYLQEVSAPDLCASSKYVETLP